MKYGVIDYSSHGHSSRSEGTVDGQIVVVIHKHQNHTSSNHDVYSVEVSGKELPKRYREIGEAREAGRAAYESR